MTVDNHGESHLLAQALGSQLAHGANTKDLTTSPISHEVSHLAITIRAALSNDDAVLVLSHA